MKKILLVFLMSIGSLFATEMRNGVVTLDGDDFIGITTPYDESLSSRFAEKLLTYEGKTLYIYFDSPGGSVFSMSRMIELMRISKIEFVCVARMAASAAFMTFQHCDRRFILPDGILMAHNASGGFSGEFPRVRSLLDVIDGLIKPIEERVAKRLRMSFSEYKTAINNNLWLNSSTAKDNNAVDGIINITCSKSIVNQKVTVTETVRTLFGPTTTEKTISRCPLIKGQ